MRIEIKIEEGCDEPKIVVVTKRVTDEINEIVKKLSGEQSQVIAGFRGEQVIVNCAGTKSNCTNLRI